MKKSKRKTPRQFRKAILIICDGLTEKYYLESMKQEINQAKNHAIKIVPQLGRSDAFENVFEMIEKELNAAEDEVPYKLIFYVRDIDTCYNQNKIASYNDLKKKLLKNPNAKNRLFFIESRPCIEFWFLLHYSQSDSPYIFCAEAISELKKHLKDYEKTAEYAKQAYEKLRPCLETAVKNAEAINNKPRDSKEKYSYSKISVLYQKLREL